MTFLSIKNISLLGLPPNIMCSSFHISSNIFWIVLVVKIKIIGLVDEKYMLGQRDAHHMNLPDYHFSWHMKNQNALTK
jgi:hypothetical protein